MLVQMLRNWLMADESSPIRSKSSEVWSCLLCHFQIFIYRRAVNCDLACLFIDLANKNKCPRLELEQWGVRCDPVYCLQLWSGSEFPLTLLGVLGPWSANARPSAQPPIDTNENFRRTCLQSHLQTSPPTPQKSCPKFRNPRTTFEIFQKKL